MNVVGITALCLVLTGYEPWLVPHNSQTCHKQLHPFPHISMCSFYIMLESSSSDAVTCPGLTRSANFEIWELQITSKLCQGKVLSATLSTDILLTAQTSSTPSTSTSSTSSTSGSTAMPQCLTSSASSTEDTRKWMEYDEKAYGIIQDHISNALLIKTRSHKTAKALFDALIEIHWAVSLPTTFYAFQQLFASTWDGTSPISDHIVSLQILETWLARMKFSIDQRVLAFILLNSLLKTLEWNSFISSVINTVEETKLTLDTIEVHILSEDSQLNPPSSESALKVSNKGRNHIRSDFIFCEHHQHSRHTRNDCYAYQHWLNSGHSSSDTHAYQNWAKELQRGGGGKWKGKDKDKDKANVSEDPPEWNSRTSEHVNIATEHVSCSLIHRIQAYLLSESNAKGKDTIIIDSRVTSHMVPHHSWFHSYTPLSTPHTVTLGNGSTAYAIYTGSVIMWSVVNGKTYDIILSNVLLILEFHLSFISVHCLSSVGLSTIFSANSSSCFIKQGRTPILIGTHWHGLYHAGIWPELTLEAVLASVDINLLHWHMGHIPTSRIE